MRYEARILHGLDELTPTVPTEKGVADDTARAPRLQIESGEIVSCRSRSMKRQKPAPGSPKSAQNPRADGSLRPRHNAPDTPDVRHCGGWVQRRRTDAVGLCRAVRATYIPERRACFCAHPWLGLGGMRVGWEWAKAATVVRFGARES